MDLSVVIPALNESKKIARDVEAAVAFLQGNNFTGEIILLTDNVVYSAAESFAHFCKETDWATIYGTATGGDGLLLWPLYCILPNSKIIINMASTLGLDTSGHANEEVRTQPDVYYESAFGNFSELIDYVINDLKGT